MTRALRLRWVLRELRESDSLAVMRRLFSGVFVREGPHGCWCGPGGRAVFFALATLTSPSILVEPDQAGHDYHANPDANIDWFVRQVEGLGQVQPEAV